MVCRKKSVHAQILDLRVYFSLLLIAVFSAIFRFRMFLF